MPVGRPTSCTPEVIEIALNYVSDDEDINYKSHDHAIPSVVGLTRVLKVARSSIYNWADEENNIFLDILAAVNEYQEFAVINGTLKNEMNANIGKLILGKHGYHEKTDQTLSSPSGGPVETVINFIPVNNKTK